jgi:autotransporter translocation and assembly factor TamB
VVSSRGPWRWLRWVIGAVVVIVVLAVAGSWTVTFGSRVGYRVKEILAGQSHTAVGRSSSVSGSMTIKGSTVKTARFTVKMATIRTELTPGAIEVQGSIPVLFSTWGIPNPSFTGFVTTQNHGIMEFLLDFRPA